jgi:tripartite-type tricarboxylate transporter receptor subunit TctC
MLASASSVAPHIRSGRLKALGVTSAKPSEMIPGLTTVSASGLPGYEAVVMNCVFAPAKTPEAIIKQLNQEIVKVLKQPEIKEKLLNAGMEVLGSSPEQSAAMIKSDMTIMGKLIKDAGIRAE